MSKKDSKPDKNTTLHLSAGATTIAGSTARMTVSVRGPLPENHELYAIIGRVAAAWAHLEHMLDLIIWDLASISPDKGACITGQLMGASPRYHVILTLSMTHGMKEQTLRVIRKLMRKTMDVNEERNRIVHDAWYLESPSGKTFQFRSMMPKKDPTYGFNAIDGDYIAGLLGRINRRIDNVSDLRSSILDELRPSP